MFKRRRTYLLLVAVATAALLGGMWLNTPAHRINRASFEQITVGMHFDDVERLLRCPPGRYCSASALVQANRPDGSAYGHPVDDILEPELQPDGSRWLMWASDNGVIGVLFDPEDKVVDMEFLTMYDEGLLVQVRRWLASVL